MSLLLDALKKAAQQKAEKDQDTEVEIKQARSDDETILLETTNTTVDDTITTGGPDDETVLLGGEATQVPKETVAKKSPDTEETVLGGVEDETRLGQKQSSDNNDETELTQTATSTRSSEDETAIYDDDPEDQVEISAAGKSRQSDSEETNLEDGDESFLKLQKKNVNEDDDTELTGLASTKSNLGRASADDDDADQVVIRENSGKAASQSEETNLETKVEETELDQQVIEHQPKYKNSEKDDTEITGMAASQQPAEDETVVLTDDDVTEFLGHHEPLPKKSPPPASSAKTPDDDTPVKIDNEQEDISLNLRGTDDTTPLMSRASDTEMSQSQLTDAELQILARTDSATESLNLVDIPESDNTETVTSRQNRSVALGSLVNEETVTRHDSTSTRTYAPDNYDRTLIKVDHDDASKIFAGMKSDSGVVMTPDYAKKVFINNSTVQRFNHYKVYTGTAIILLLFIFVLGLFEYSEESDNIDNSLRALKRDPMPNAIKPVVRDEKINLFDDPEVAGLDTKTLALVENADQVTEPDLEPVESEVEANEEISGTIGTTGAEKPTTQKSETSQSKKIEVANKQAGNSSSASDDKGASKAFQLSSKNVATKKDQLLEEAYAAYQRGDTETALVKYNQVLKEDSGNRNALLARAAINVQNDNVEDAIDDYQTLLIANPTDSLAMSSLISVASISPAKSESQLKGMIRDEPASPYLNFALGNVYGAQNRWQEAQSRYFTALENNPGDPNYAYNLAVSLEHISQPKAAVTYYQRALANFNNGLATFNREVVDQRLEILQQL